MTPISNCPHVAAHVLVDENQLPQNPSTAVCTHDSENAPRTGGLKSAESCQSSHENWVCLSCGVVRCSRYVQGHALDHYQDSLRTMPNSHGHCVVASLADLSVWCHACQAYILPQSDARLSALVQTLETRKFADPNVPAAETSEETRADS